MAHYHDVVSSIVKGRLDGRWINPEAFFKPTMASWQSVANKINKDIAVSNCRSLDCENYEEDFALIANSFVVKADALEILPNSRSFELRRELIKNARKRIHIFVWALNDNKKGDEFLKLLFEALKTNPLIDIRIVVDVRMANLIGIKLLKNLDKRSQ